MRARMASAQARVDRLGRLIDKAYEDKLEGRIDDEFFHSKRMEWEQRSEAAREIERLTRVSAKNLDTGLMLLELANSASELLSQQEPLERRELLEVLCSNSILTGDHLAKTLRSTCTYARRHSRRRSPSRRCWRGLSRMVGATGFEPATP